MSANTTGPAELLRNTVLNPFSNDELRDLAAAWEADRAALERARALVPMAVAECVQKHTYSRFGVNNRCEFCGCSGALHLLAATLAPDGAKSAPHTEPTCDLCKIQAGIQAAMDIIEPLPEIGDHYDAMVTRAFDALDDAYGYHRHEHSAPDGAR